MTRVFHDSSRIFYWGGAQEGDFANWKGPITLIVCCFERGNAANIFKTCFGPPMGIDAGNHSECALVSCFLLRVQKGCFRRAADDVMKPVVVLTSRGYWSQFVSCSSVLIGLAFRGVAPRFANGKEPR
eukprot:6214230-Pyramimonas_sp.AAC.1